MIEHIALHVIKISNQFNTKCCIRNYGRSKKNFQRKKYENKDAGIRYLFELLSSTNHIYFSRNSENFPQLWTKHDFFKNSLFPSTIKEWNTLDPQIRKSKYISIFKSNKPNNVYYCQNPKGISTSNLMFKREIRDKSTEFSFLKF